MNFSAKELEFITGGTWENLTENLIFDNLNFNTQDVKKDDLFITRSTKQFPELYNGNEDKLKYLEKIGVKAIIIRDGIEFKTSIPALVVKNTKDALKNIAITSRKNTQAKIVLVTGSYGKTGFKIHLNHLLGNIIKTKIVQNSANEDSGVYKAISILDKDDEVAIIEVAGSSFNNATRRAKVVQPDICIITSIGHEDIHLHKTIDNTIDNKASVAKYLSLNGTVIIKKDQYYNKLTSAILQHNPNAIIKSFGEDKTSNAYVIKKEFIKFGWEIEASIAGIIIKYHIPFMDLHSVDASLSEFLVAYTLGIDIKQICVKYKSIQNFKSSGIFYEIKLNNKNFFLYDQSQRGGIENYENFFKTLEYIIPKNGGKKIVLTSAFMDYKDNDMKHINQYIYQELIQKANINALFTVERFSDHIEVLKDRTIWKKHNYDYEAIKDDVLDYISSDDIVFVKGIFGSSLYKFLHYIKSLPNVKVKKYKDKEEEKFIAEKLNISHLEIYKQKLEESNNIAWCYYFPFLFNFNKSKNKELLIEEIDGSLVIYFLRGADTHEPILELFFPPMPLNEDVLKKVQEKIYKFRGEKISNILWVDENDKELVSKYFRVIKKEQEFIYSTKTVLQLTGSKLKNLRYNLKKFSLNENVYIRDYHIDDYYACVKLQQEWAKQQKEKYDAINDLEYTKECLKNAPLFTKKDMFGKVVFINNRLKAFGFAGLMYENVGNIFILKADISIIGLGYFLKYKLIQEMESCDYINDSSDLGYEGLRNAKKSFGPTKMLQIYKARDGF